MSNMDMTHSLIVLKYQNTDMTRLLIVFTCLIVNTNKLKINFKITNMSKK